MNTNDPRVNGSEPAPAVIDPTLSEPADVVPLGSPPGELVHVTRAEGALMPLPAEQVVAGMRAYQQLLKELLEPSDWQTHDKDSRQLPKPFLKKSGWRKISRAFNLSFARVHARVERAEDGTPVRAEVWIRAIAPNGQYGDGDGYCSSDEGRFRSWRGRQKLENDLRATATTRAKNRAIADLVGMGEVSFEEIAPVGEEDEHAQALAAGAPASEELARHAFAALARLLGDGEPGAARRVGEQIAADHGYLPVAVGRALCYAAAAHAPRHARNEPATGHLDLNEDERAQAAERVLELARHGGYRQETLREVCRLLYDTPGLEQLAGIQLRHLAELLRSAIASGTDDEPLARATERCAQQPDRDQARQALARWLTDRTHEANAA